MPPLVAGQVLPTVLALWGPWVLTQRAGDVAFTLCVARHPFWICVCGTHLSTLCHVQRRQPEERDRCGLARLGVPAGPPLQRA